MQNPPPGQAGKSSTGLDENIAALLAYVFGWVSGLVFFLIEKDSKLVRFHAMQSIMFNALVLVLSVVLWIVTFVLFLMLAMLPDIMGALMGLLTSLLWLIFFVALLAGWIMCLVKAYQGQFFKLPIIGNMAEKIVNK
ncbi:MAG TPA: DUF4870 domain-containing protein [Pyrinomonadaceae bacterium]|nr:DUF4870 domain-containing protein [Pyrinomonadaceae bacterium]